MYFLIGSLMVYGSITSMAQSFVSSWKNFAIWCCSRPCKPSPCKYWKSSGFSFSGKTDTKVAFQEELISAFSFSFVGSSLRTILAKRSKWSFISFHLWDNAQILSLRKVLSYRFDGDFIWGVLIRCSIAVINALPIPISILVLLQAR